MGHLLKELLLPFIKPNYCLAIVHTYSAPQPFLENKNYMVHTLSGYTRPSFQAIKILSMKKTKTGQFYAKYMIKSKIIRKKVQYTLLGNQRIRLNQSEYLSAGSRRRQLLFTKKYITFKNEMDNVLDV